MDREWRITQHIRFGYTLPFGTLFPSVATSYVLETLYEIPTFLNWKNGERKCIPI